MSLSDIGFGLLAVGLGAGTGLLFLCGLWVTVRQLPSARHPAAWALASFLVRVGGTAVVFGWVAKVGDWIHVLLALGGFLLMRTIWTHRVSRSRTKRGSQHGYLA